MDLLPRWLLQMRLGQLSATGTDPNGTAPQVRRAALLAVSLPPLPQLYCICPVLRRPGTAGRLSRTMTTPVSEYFLDGSYESRTSALRRLRHMSLRTRETKRLLLLSTRPIEPAAASAQAPGDRLFPLAEAWADAILQRRGSLRRWSSTPCGTGST